MDALEPSVREELVNNFCSRELTSYEQIFEGAGWLIYLCKYFIEIPLQVLESCFLFYQNLLSWIKLNEDMLGSNVE